MANEKNLISAEGLAKLEERLQYLKTVKRAEVADHIETARSFGDLSENAEYDEAKNEQAFMEGEIAEIEAQLRNAVVVEDDGGTDRIRLGLTVTVWDEDEDEEMVLTLVGSAEADAMHDRISIESPVGQALMGHKEGDHVSVEVPGGVIRLVVRAIQK
nr:transcription elongation factor GreA [bacterium]